MRFHTVTLKPWRSKFIDIAFPIIPNPKNPISSIYLSLSLQPPAQSLQNNPVPTKLKVQKLPRFLKYKIIFPTETSYQSAIDKSLYSAEKNGFFFPPLYHYIIIFFFLFLFLFLRRCKHRFQISILSFLCGYSAVSCASLIGQGVYGGAHRVLPRHHELIPLSLLSSLIGESGCPAPLLWEMNKCYFISLFSIKRGFIIFYNDWLNGLS